MTTGLGGNNINKNWSDSKDNTVYLSSDPLEALAYAETSELLDDDTMFDEIIIIQINTKFIDKNKLISDTNIKNDDHNSYEYNGIIPPQYLKIIE